MVMKIQRLEVAESRNVFVFVGLYTVRIERFRKEKNVLSTGVVQ
jgi:hypothetical protein